MSGWVITWPRPKTGGRVLKCSWFVFLFFLFCRFFGVADCVLWTQIGSRPDDTFFVVSRTV